MEDLLPVQVVRVAAFDAHVDRAIEQQALVLLVGGEELLDLATGEVVLAQLSPDVLFVQKRFHRVVHLSGVHQVLVVAKLQQNQLDQFGGQIAEALLVVRRLLEREEAAF